MIGYLKLYRDFGQDAPPKSLFIRPINTREVQVKRNKIIDIVEIKSDFWNFSNVNIESSGWVMGSLQVLNNMREEIYGFSDLTYQDISNSISFMEHNIIDIDKMTITNLEFGINLFPKEPYNDIVNNRILTHKYRIYNHNKWRKLKGSMKVFEYYNFHYLIYNKALQLKFEDNCLRFELRFIRSLDLKHRGIFSIIDLKNKDKLMGIADLFMKRFNELVIVDSIENNRMISEKDSKNLIEYFDPKYWTKISKQKRQYHKKKLNYLVHKYGLDSTKKELSMELLFRINNLLIN